jgi:transposase
MFYVGLDVHLRTSTWCILDQAGKFIKQETLRGDVDQVVTRLAQLKGPWSVCYEASCGYGVLHDKLARVGARVVVAHPGKLRLIFKSKRKNDQVDAKKLATLLLLDQVPEVWVPTAQLRQWRELIEFRKRLTQKQTRCKSQIKTLLRGLGIRKITAPVPATADPVVSSEDLAPATAVDRPRKGSGMTSGHPGLWGKKGMTLLAEMELPTEIDGMRRDLLLEELGHFQRQLAKVEKRLDGLAEDHPEVELLRSIPGVGPRTAEAVMAYIGDPQRFARNKQIGAYAGLVPCEDSSAGAHRLGHITKDGPGTLRWLLVEAAWQGVRLSPTIKAYYERISRNHPDHKKIALVATAHHLLRVMLSMLKSGEVWHEDPALAETAVLEAKV